MSAATTATVARPGPDLAPGPTPSGGNGCHDGAGNAIGSAGRARVGPRRIHVSSPITPIISSLYRVGAPERLGHDGHPLGGTRRWTISARPAQRGQILPLFALALTALVLGAAVVVDGGYGFAQRRGTQNAADFAAMAGTRIVGEKLTGNPPGAGTAGERRRPRSESVLDAHDAQLVSARYVDEDGLALGNVVGAGSIPNDAFGVVVEARTNWRPFLLGVIGVVDWAGVVAGDGRDARQEPRRRRPAGRDR